MAAIADAHNDLLLGVHHRRERGFSDPFGDFWLPQLRAGNVVFQVLPLFTEEQFVGEGALRRALDIVETARWLAQVHCSDVVIVETRGDLDGALDDGRIALLLALEGAEPIGNSISLLDTFWRLGVRTMSLTWNRRTMMADGIAETDSQGSLTRLGVEAIARMEELGMVVDVSHLSACGFDEVATIARRPFVATHSSCATLHEHPRNLADAQIEAVARSGGFIGLNSFGPFLGAEPTVELYVAHIAHALSVAGPDGVALGADFVTDLIEHVDPILGGALVDPSDLAPTAGLIRPADYQRVWDQLEQRLGVGSARKIASQNMIDFFRAALPA